MKNIPGLNYGALTTCFILLVSVSMTNRVLAMESPVPRVPAKGNYVVLVSAKTSKSNDWMAVVSELRKKHDASLIVYPTGRVATALPELKKLHPRYAAFVTAPEEAGRKFVVAVHRLTRKLDADPYTDVRWGIVTGYEAADARRIAKRSEPLIINSAASSMGPGLFKTLDHGFASSETNAKVFWIKKTGSDIKKQAVSPDPVKSLVDAFNTQSPDMFVTSGHATERNWQVIYNKHLGYFKCGNGQLYGENSKKQTFEIKSPGVKIYLPKGNCLIGHVPDKNCMALAWMHTGGVHQMFGYTTVTFHGYMGWGIGSFFGKRYTLSEAFYFNNQSLIWELNTLFPKKAGVEFDSYSNRGANRLAQKHKIRDRKLLGHLWDRDVVAFYGDPAWVARHDNSDPAWKVDYSHTGENVKVTISFLKDGKWGNRPLAVPFPERLGRIRLVECSDDLKPLVVDDFALIPLQGKPYKAGQTVTLTFGAHTIEAKKTSADAKPFVATAGNDTPQTDLQATGKFDPRNLGLSKDMTRRILYAYRYAQSNGQQIAKALLGSKKDEREDVCFLVANMPLRDLRTLTADYLLENVRYARKAMTEAPWKDKVSKEIYQEYVLPYANLTEKRETWRKEFYEKLKPAVKGIDSPGEVAVKLNQTIYNTFNVKYHATKRPHPDQGPLESIKATFASCTGLSILLVDACRAVGIPARVAGVAQWTKGPGNHTWVEVWDDGWHCLGAAESKKLNGVWFGKGAAAADTSDPMKRVYAAKFSRDSLRFPIAWNPYADYVPAVDVSQWYKDTFGKEETGE